MSKRVIHSFTSQTQMSEIIAVLGRIGQAGGKKAFSSEKAPYKVAGKAVHLLMWDTSAYERHLAKMAKEGRTTHIAPDEYDLDRVEHTLGGMVRGLTYAAGGTR